MILDGDALVELIRFSVCLVEFAPRLCDAVISLGLLEIWITAASQLEAALFCGSPRSRGGFSALDILGSGEY